MTEIPKISHLICGTSCLSNARNIIISNGLARCVGCPFENCISDAQKATKHHRPPVLIKRAKLNIDYWRRRFACEKSQHDRTKAKNERLRREITNLQIQLKVLKGGN